MPSVIPTWRRMRANWSLVFYFMVSLFLPARILNLWDAWQTSRWVFSFDLGIDILMVLWWIWVTVMCLRLIKARFVWILPLSAPLLLASISASHQSRAWHIVGTVVLAAAIIPPIYVLRSVQQKIAETKSGEGSGISEA
jgi:hypothetical protein